MLGKIICYKEIIYYRLPQIIELKYLLLEFPIWEESENS